MMIIRVDARATRIDGDLIYLELSRGGKRATMTVQDGMTLEEMAFLALNQTQPEDVPQTFHKRVTIDAHRQDDGGGEYWVVDSATAEALPDEQARLDFAALGNWAVWSGDQAADWIETNVVDMASAKVALKALARAVCALRDWRVDVLDVAE